MKIRKVATFILYDKKSGKFLFQEKTDYKAYMGYVKGGLSLFGGGVDGKETYLQAAKREAMEELGYKLTKTKFFYLEKNIMEDVAYTAKIFVAPFDAKQKLKINFETKKLWWLTIPEVLKFKMSEHRRKFFLDNLKKFEKLV